MPSQPENQSSSAAQTQQPQIYLCYGMHKSGSTLAYELTRALLEALGYPNHRLSDAVIDSKYNVNFLGSKAMKQFDESYFQRLLAEIGPNGLVALKTHSSPSEFLISLLQSGKAIGQANFRDPRDCIPSLMDAGRKAIRKGRGSFQESADWDIATAFYDRQLVKFEKYCACENILQTDFETVAFSSAQFLQQVAGQLGTDRLSDDTINQLVTQVKTDCFTQFNRGQSRRYRDDLTVNQALLLTQRYHHVILRYQKDSLDNLDRALLDVAPTMPTPEARPADNDSALLETADRSTIDTTPASTRKTPFAALTRSYNQMRQHNHFRTLCFLLGLESWLAPQKASSWPIVQEASIPKNASPSRTFVVLGCPRGGTSLVAGTLNAAGIYMGDYRTLQYEDPLFKIPIRQARQAVELLANTIDQRNASHANWGWKLPNTVYYIRHIQHLLRAPCYLFIYRDPVDIARSSAKHDKHRLTIRRRMRLLRVAKNHTARLQRFQESLADGTDMHIFQLETIHQDPEGFVDTMTKILEPIVVDKNKLLAFIKPEGGYHPQPKAQQVAGTNP